LTNQGDKLVVKTAMHYQHPELEIVHAALDYNAIAATAEMRV